MEHSGDYLWTVGSVFPAPLLLTSSAASTIGPLHFHPATPPATLFSFTPPPPPPLALPRDENSLRDLQRSVPESFVPLSALSSASAAVDDDLFGGSTGLLQSVKLSNADVVFFFPIGDNSDSIGGAVISKNPKRRNSRVLRFWQGRGQRICQISATDLIGYCGGDGDAEGMLMVCSLLSVRWFRLELRFFKPFLCQLAFSDFGSRVSHACWSPHIPEESAVVLENGQLHLFDLISRDDSAKSPAKLHSTCVADNLRGFVLNECKCSFNSKFLEGLDRREFESGWWSCEFSSMPRILIVACSVMVLLVDFRHERATITVIARIDLCDSSRLHPFGNDRFTAFCSSKFNALNRFCVASRHELFLFDITMPFSPMLKWEHGIYNPDHVEVHRLSELRLRSDDEFNWASSTGFVILLGSFRNGVFKVFCYGPRPNNKGLKLNHISSLYAWELPTELTLSSNYCGCTKCIFEKEFTRDGSSCETTISGFCIFSMNDLVTYEYGIDFGRHLCVVNGGFGLVKLLSSGEIDYQIYEAAWQGPSVCRAYREDRLPDSQNLVSNESNMIESMKPGFFAFDFVYLLAYLNGGTGLFDRLVSRLETIASKQMLEDDVSNSFQVQACKEYLVTALRAAGINGDGVSLPVGEVLSSVGMPSSVYEIACGRTWMSLSLPLLQLAFVRNSDLAQPKGIVYFPDVPSCPPTQLPPFPLRIPSNVSEVLPPNVSSRGSVVGPVLPLPVLLSLQHLDEGTSIYSSKKRLSVLTKVDRQCEELLGSSELLALRALDMDQEHEIMQLADDIDVKWDCFQEVIDKSPLFLHEPCNFNSSTSSASFTSTREGSRDVKGDLSKDNDADEKFNIFVSRIDQNMSSPKNEQKDIIGQFDNLCPINLGFSSSGLVCGSKEAQAYQQLMHKFSNWQGSFKPYQSYLSSKLHRRGI